MSETKKGIKLFEERQVRTAWDEEAEKWWFSILDIITILTDQPDYEKTRNYWKWLKRKLREEGSELVSVTNQLKLEAADGKKYLTDVADTEQVLRLIQSIPSKKAEPFKLWLAKVGNERIDETVDPELSINRAIQNYRRLGYSENWINQRIQSGMRLGRERRRKELCGDVHDGDDAFIRHTGGPDHADRADDLSVDFVGSGDYAACVERLKARFLADKNLYAVRTVGNIQQLH